MHVPPWQELVQVCTPLAPHWRVVPGAQAPWPEQADQLDHVPLWHVRVWVPQFPHPWEVGPVQEQAPHWQELLQVWVPLAPHGCVVPGVQPVWPTQLDQLDHEPLALHVRVCVPVRQFPHFCEVGPGGHWQMPPTQLAPAAQTFPHFPQLDGSLAVSLHSANPQRL